MTQEMYDEVVFKERFILTYYPDRYKTQEMCDKAVDSFLLPLEFVLHCFFTSKVIDKLNNSVFSNDDLFLHDLDSNIIRFSYR